MDRAEVEALLEDAIPDSDATVTEVQDAPGHDHLHLSVTVVSSAFEGERLVDQHDAVNDALSEHLTRDIHGVEVTTYTPEQYAERRD